MKDEEKRKLIQHFITSTKNKRLKRTEKIAELIFNHPETFITANVTQMSKSLKIPVSTVFDHWKRYIKPIIKIKIELK